MRHLMRHLRIKAGKIRILSVAMAALLMLSSMLIALPADSVAKAAAGTVTKTAHSDEYGREPYFTVTNPDHGTRNATCINFNAAAPDTGTVVGSPVQSNNDKLRRVLYYGNRGPADTGVYGWTFTSMAASSAMGNIPTKDGQSLGDYYELSVFKTYPVPPSTFKVYIVSTGKEGYQDLAYWVIEQPKYGAVEVYKKSANESITNGNACYSLEGCVIGLYKHGSTAEIGRFTTNAAGYGGKIGNLEPGQYDLKELQAPKGLVLDQTIITVTVEADKTTTYTLKDQPANDPVDLLLKKVDAEGNEAIVEAGTFKGAQYTFEYFDGQYSEAELAGKTPLRTWVIATDEKGRIQLYSANKISGDDFYTYLGKPVMPVGTLRVHETKAVKGYLLDPTVYIINIVPEEFTGRLIKSYQPVTSPEQVIRGGVELNKVDSRTGQPLEGVEFAVKDATGAIVATLITDSNGYAATANNALAYGSYTLVETKAKTGYNLDSTPKPFSVTENGKLVSFTGDSSIPNTQQPGFIEIIKTDEKSGKSIEGVEFTIYSDKDCTKAIQTITTDANGYAKSKALTAGTYYIKETKVKTGYVMSAEVFEGKVIAANATKIEITNKPVMLTIKLTKTDDKSGAGVSGAVYSLYAREDIVTASGDVVYTAGSLVKDFPETNDSGAATLRNLYLGKYFVKEKTAPASGIYQLDTTEYDVEAVADESSPAVITVNVEVTEKRAPGYLQIVKTDESNGEPLEGVEFGIYSDEACTKLVQTLVTDAAGKAKSKALSEGKYYIKEVKAKEGYVLSTEVHEGIISASKTTTVKITNNLIRGGVKIEKTDAISGSTPQGASTFEGVEFTICKITHTEKGVYPEEVMTIVTDKTGIAQTDADSLEYGSYTIYESKVSKGLKINSIPINFRITKPGYVDLTGSKGIADEVIRGDIKGIKSASDGVKLAGVPFKITSVTTGESHVIVTDANGEFDTSSSSRPHSSNTNRGMEAKDGVWFGAGEPDDKLGALPYDTYIIEELPCEVNEYMILIEPFKIVVAKDAVTVELESIINEYRSSPTIHTVATVVGTDDSHYAPTIGEVTLKETVYMEKLVPGWTYDLLAVGKDYITVKNIIADGRELSDTMQLTADAETMTVDFYFTVKDASQLKGHVIVFCEYLSRKGKLLAVHENMEDLGQSIYFPELHTTAVDNITGTHISNPEGKVTHTDRIYYAGAQPGKEVPIKAYPVFKDNGEAVLNDGQPVKIETTLVPDAVSGFIDLTFTFDASQLAGRAIVYCEGWYEDDRLITLHANLDDEGQSIYFPAIHTTATGKDGSKTITTDGTQTITDKIDYINFTDGKYRAVTSAMILDDKGNVTELKVNGKPVISETWFNVSELNGSVNVELKFNATGIAGKVVIYEKVYDENGNLIARHENPKDEGQTVTIVPPPETPKTGDTANILLLLALAIISFAGIIIVIKKRVSLQ